MEDKILSGYTKVQEEEYEVSVNSNPLTNERTSPPFQSGLTSEDILLETFPEEEIFILSEDYVRMEGEYVMGQGTSNRSTKSQGKGPGNDDEGQLILPFEDSLQSLNEFFTLKTINRPIRYN